MKKILTILFLFSTLVLNAETFDIVVSGKPGGTFHTRAMLMHDALIDLGHEVNLINAGNLSKSAQIFSQSNGKLLMPWIDSANLKENLQPTQETFGLLEYTAPIVFCSTKYKQFDADVIKIGHSASWPTEIFSSLEEALGKPVKDIAYRNSGDLVLAFVSGEIDYISINMSKIKKLPANSCFAVTGDQPIGGVDPISTLLPDFAFRDIKQHAYWLIKNQNPKVSNILQQAINSPSYSAWLGSQLFIKGSLENNDLSNTQKGSLAWGLQE